MRTLRLIVVSFICTFVLAPISHAEEPAPPETPEPPPASISTDTEYISGISEAERAHAFLDYDAHLHPKQPLYPKAAACAYVARLVLHHDVPYALDQLDQALTAVLAKGQPTTAGASPHALDPFDEHALMHTWLLCHDQLPPAFTSKLKAYLTLWHHRKWLGYGAMNYRLMEDGSAFLASEQWPDFTDIDGLKAPEIQAATKARLLSYCDDIVHHNFPEYEAPTYYGIDLSAMKMLADFAHDPEMKNRATLTLDWMILNVACSWNQGYNTATCGRAKYWVSTKTSPEEMDSTAAIAWLYFGGKRPVCPRGMDDALSIWFACPGTYQLPPIFSEIAQDRSSPVTHQGSVILGKDESVRLTIYHNPSFSLASQAEFLSAPTNALYKETRRNMLKWISDRPASTFCPLQENPRRPYKLSEHIANAFGYGENPFSQSLQDHSTLIGVYAVPSDYQFYKLYAPFSLSGSILKRFEKDGWVICHGGSTLFAFRCVKPYTWGKPQQENDILWSDFRTGGWILEAVPESSFAGGGVAAELDRFATALQTKTKLVFDEKDPSQPRLTYTSLSGHLLDIVYRPHGAPYRDQQLIDAKPIDYSNFPLLGNPWVHQEVNGRVLSLRHGTAALTYDFQAWTKIAL